MGLRPAAGGSKWGGGVSTSRIVSGGSREVSGGSREISGGKGGEGKWWELVGKLLVGTGGGELAGVGS